MGAKDISEKNSLMPSLSAWDIERKKIIFPSCFANEVTIAVVRTLQEISGSLTRSIPADRDAVRACSRQEG